MGLRHHHKDKDNFPPPTSPSPFYTPESDSAFISTLATIPVE